MGVYHASRGSHADHTPQSATSSRPSAAGQLRLEEVVTTGTDLVPRDAAVRDLAQDAVSASRIRAKARS